MIEQSVKGNQQAVKELIDRTEGKVAQPVSANIEGQVILRVVEDR